jgi:hypothetical protein
LEEPQDTLYTPEMAQRMARREQGLYQLGQLGTDPIRLGLRRAHLKAPDAELAVWIVLLVGRELPKAGQACVGGQPLVIRGEDLDKLVARKPLTGGLLAGEGTPEQDAFRGHEASSSAAEPVPGAANGLGEQRPRSRG